MPDEPQRQRQLDGIPTPLTSFIGREHELALVERMLLEYRLLTLTGAGGSGKTRLALHAAAGAVMRFPSGVWFVDLAPLTQAELLAERVAQALGITDTSGRPVSDVLCETLSAQRLLLLLDNCEHLASACAQMVVAVLARCPEVKVLATSREPLAIVGEAVLQVPPLSLPVRSLHPNPQDLLRSDAVLLFVERATAADGRFRLTEGNVTAIADICTHLDGLPLALELAATRVRGVPLAELAKRLGDGSLMLRQGDPSVPVRQQTLQALITWSYGLLDERERVVFRRLAVFAPYWALNAAEVICAGDYATEDGTAALAQADVLDTVLHLVDRSLVQLDYGADRYRLLETIRMYAHARLDEAGEARKISHRHFEWYLSLVEAGAQHFGGPGERDWLDTVEREHDNARTALGWAISEGDGLAEEAARMALALWPFWHARSYLREAQRWLERVLALSDHGGLPLAMRARLLNALGVAAHTLGQLDQSSTYHDMAIQIWRELGDHDGLFTATLDRGWFYFHQWDLEQACVLAEECLALARETENRRSIAAALTLHGAATSLSEHPETAIPDAEECLKIWQELGDEASIASARVGLAAPEVMLGHYERAKPLVMEALQGFIGMGAIGSLRAAVALLMQLALHSTQQPEGARRAAQLLGYSYSWDERHGSKNTPMASYSQVQIAQPATRLLGVEAFQQEVEAGKQLTLDGLLALATAITQPDRTPPEAPPQVRQSHYPNDLTQREIEVLRLVAAGHSNPQIATELVLSVRTVEAHLRSIFAKLDVTSRTAAVRFALEHDLG